MDFEQIKTGKPETITKITDDVIDNLVEVKMFQNNEETEYGKQLNKSLNKWLLYYNKKV